ncbi:MAG: MmgE/PrpD family protein [Ardenticatenaceae bacterium]
MNALEKLAHWAATASPEHTSTAYEWVSQALIDTMGCMIAGSEHEVSQKVFAAVSEWGIKRSSVIGHAERLPAPWAALVNGTSAHALDFNAWTDPTAAFTPSCVLTALLAVAEEQNCDGAAVLDALIVGMEVAMRVGEAVNLDHYHRGWHTTATVDTIGAAAGCARLLGLDEQQIGYAMSIAISRAAGFKSQFGTMTKPLHCGLTAQTGVMAAQLAATGLTAATDTLDGKWSVLTVMAGEGAAGFAQPLAKLGQTLAVDEFGIVFKRYPSCAYTHRTLDGILALRETHQLQLDAIEAVTVRIPAHNASILTYPVPETETQARFSMPYCVATALHTGHLTPNDFDDEALWRRPVRDFLSRVTLETHPINANSSDLAAQEPALITIQLRNGLQVHQQVDIAIGMRDRPFSSADLRRKFHNLADPVCGTAKSEQILALLYDFAHQDTLPTLMRLLRSDS